LDDVEAVDVTSELERHGARIAQGKDEAHDLLRTASGRDVMGDSPVSTRTKY
jgi:hypothetical protein